MVQVNVVGYRFGEFELNLERGRLLRSGAEVELRPKAFDVLRHLVENGGKLVSKDDLVETVWPDVTVSDDSLSQCVLEVRKGLGDRDHSLVRTVPRRGYILEGEVTAIGAEGAADAARSGSPGGGGRVAWPSLAILTAALAGIAIGAIATPPMRDAGIDPSQQIATILSSPPLQSSRTVVGETIKAYPAGKPEITGVLVVLPAGFESGWHTHSVPVLAYIMEGEVSVDYGSKGVRVYSAGDIILEAMDWPHNARNVSGSTTLVFVAYLGVVGGEITTPAEPPDDRPLSIDGS